jgi:hypothetical protein
VHKSFVEPDLFICTTPTGPPDRYALYSALRANVPGGNMPYPGPKPPYHMVTDPGRSGTSGRRIICVDQ